MHEHLHLIGVLHLRCARQWHLQRVVKVLGEIRVVRGVHIRVVSGVRRHVGVHTGAWTESIARRRIHRTPRTLHGVLTRIVLSGRSRAVVKGTVLRIVGVVRIGGMGVQPIVAVWWRIDRVIRIHLRSHRSIAGRESLLGTVDKARTHQTVCRWHGRLAYLIRSGGAVDGARLINRVYM